MRHQKERTRVAGSREAVNLRCWRVDLTVLARRLYGVPAVQGPTTPCLIAK
jgi:hypothetical protein